MHCTQCVGHQGSRDNSQVSKLLIVLIVIVQYNNLKF